MSHDGAVTVGKSKALIIGNLRRASVVAKYAQKSPTRTTPVAVCKYSTLVLSLRIQMEGGRGGGGGLEGTELAAHYILHLRGGGRGTVASYLQILVQSQAFHPQKTFG